MEKNEAAKLIRNLASASIAHYEAVNGLNRTRPKTAAAKEEKAVRALVKALGCEFTDAEVEAITT